MEDRYPYCIVEQSVPHRKACLTPRGHGDGGAHHLHYNWHAFIVENEGGYCNPIGRTSVSYHGGWLRSMAPNVLTPTAAPVLVSGWPVTCPGVQVTRGWPACEDTTCIGYDDIRTTTHGLLYIFFRKYKPPVSSSSSSFFCGGFLVVIDTLIWWDFTPGGCSSCLHWIVVLLVSCIDIVDRLIFAFKFLMTLIWCSVVVSAVVCIRVFSFRILIFF